MDFNKQKFLEELNEILEAECGCTAEKATPNELHNALSKTLMSMLAENWKKSKAEHLNKKCAYYLSAEFLVGRMIYNNLLSLGLYSEVSSALNSVGVDLNVFEDVEDMALGNGGLGRLAACFLDSAATHDIPLDGYGIRYRYGLFKQSIVDGFQKETADNWARLGDPWSVRRESESVTVEFGDQTVTAVPYDMPVIGYGTNNIGTLRLWQAEAVNEFDFTLFNDQKYDEAAKERNRAFDITAVLYPNDSTKDGKKLRLKQQYFFSSASLKDIIRNYKSLYGNDFSKFAEKNSVQLNDTHPVISIPELIRLLMDNEGLTFNAAFEVAQKTFNYTNHTVMPEALEKWSCELMKEVAPRVYEIILMINEHFLRDMAFMGYRPRTQKVRSTLIVANGTIHMAHLAIYASSHTNGVARLHTELLKTTVLKDWYELYPDRFLNMTNGITQRRWLALCNKELSTLITRLLGSQKWVKELDELKKLSPCADDPAVMKDFMAIKRAKKEELAQYIEKHDGVNLNPDFIFDIQIKRLHEYKRQLLNAFSILDIYYGIKEGRITGFTPTAFIFGAKSAPGYFRAKGIIKYIGEVAKLINNDPDMQDKLKVVFISNYNVSYAEKLVTAADVSEQISTAGTEASGTGNMKFMLNGTVTLGTYDGANVEIVEEAGFENNYIFGARVEDIEKIASSYSAKEIYDSTPNIKRVVDTLIDGTFDDGETGMFKELYDSLLVGASWHKPDNYYLLYDLNPYVQEKLKVNKEYRDTPAFAKKCWLNMTNSGKFSSDRTIKQYASEIWGVK